MAPRHVGMCLGLVLLGLGLAACTGPKSEFAATGLCRPTTQGAPAPEYQSHTEARSAFSRSSCDGAFVAVLEDVAWLRFEGCEEEIVKQHRAYFEQGYTTFQVALFTKEFTQPTGETFVLEDSKGARLTGRPVSYQGTMAQENDRFAARFSLSFRHSLTADVDWITLTRAADGVALEWMFREAPPPASATAAAGAAPGTRPVAHERPENLMKPRNPAPAPVTSPAGRPVNILRPGAAASAPTAHAPATAAPSVGEPAWSGPSAPSESFPAPAAPPPSVAPSAVAPTPPSTPPGQLPPPTVRNVR
jgi:hypothetical protein